MYRTIIGLLLLCATPIAAQTPVRTDSLPATGAHTFGLSVARLVLPGEDGSLGLVGFQMTSLHGDKVGTEFGLFTVPAAVTEGVAVFIPKLAAIWLSKHDKVWSFVKVGGWAAFSPSGGGGLLGVYGGGGVLIPTDSKWGIRLEVEPHVAVVAPTHPAFVFTIGMTSLPK